MKSISFDCAGLEHCILNLDIFFEMVQEILVNIAVFSSSILAVLVTALILYARRNYGKLEKLGIPVVPRHFFLGSSPQGYKEISHLLDEERAQKYGPIYGAYEGRDPKIYVNDPDLVKKILVKDYDYFSDRLPWELLHHEIPLGFLDFQLGENWRVLRSSLTKGLSLGRVKQMGLLSKDVIHEYFKDFIDATKDKTTIDFRKLTTPLTIELSCLLWLGIRLEDAKGGNNGFVNLIRTFFVDSITDPPTFVQTIGYVFPFLGKYISPGPFSIPFFPDESLDQFVCQVDAVLKAQREKPKTEANDTSMIHLLLELMDKTKSAEFQKLGITRNSVMSQILELFMAMYEGLPTAIPSFFYHLTKSDAANTKLLEEIDQLLESSGGKPTREEIVQLPYLSACLTEMFRIFPTFHRLDRVCVKDWKDEERGIEIKKGLPVYICLWPLHYNPKLFPNPHEFRPERFLGDAKNSQHPYAFGTFGHGPKSCPGNKLITDILKLTLFEILTYFSIQPTSAYTMKQYPGFGPFIRTNPILVDIVPRRTRGTHKSFNRA